MHMLRTAMLAAIFATFSGLARADGFEINLPEGLNSEVRFWEKVFSEYSPEQCVFHDKDDLGQVYAIAKVSDNRKKSKETIKKYSDAIQNGFLHLSEGGQPRTKLERRLVAAVKVDMRFPAYYRYAMNNFRCQRGVDLDASIQRSKKIVSFVRKTLIKSGVPEDLAYLPHLESGYIANARSKAGARGLWQFMPQTGRMWGLQISRRRDDRTNLWKSTEAAAKYFAELYRRTNSWPLAITAYNYGINGTMRAIEKYGSDYLEVRKKHETAIFGFAAKNYFPSFVAARNVASQRDGTVRVLNDSAVARGQDVRVSPAQKL
jgi:membrane-bound lytic murein transglycosylase D